MKAGVWFTVGALGLVACGAEGAAAKVGELQVALSSRLGDVEYHLTNARLRIDGPEPREVSLDGPGTLELSLPAGPHQLTLLDGWTLSRSEDGSEPVSARLLSENPASIFIGAGSVEPLSFRFALQSGEELVSGEGRLAVGIELVDGAVAEEEPSLDRCARGLRINEVDYDQEGTDDFEFVELINPGVCEAQLTGAVLELVNGSNGEVYSRLDLAELGTLAGQDRLVIGDDAITATLPDGVASLPLSGSGLQNGPDSVRLMLGEYVIDSLGYGEGAPDVEGSAGPSDTGLSALGRCPDGFDTDDNAQDFVLQVPTPGAANAC